MASFKSVMDWIGEEIEKALPWVQKGAALVGVFDPALGTVINTTAGIVATVEAKYKALGNAKGTGTQKLADALQIGEPVIAQALKLAGKASDTAAVTNTINSVVTVMNLSPAPVASPAPAA